MATSEGYIPLSRSFFEHEFWNEKREYSKAEAWLWIIEQAKYKPGKRTRIIAKKAVTWEQGQVAGALTFFRNAWNWGSVTKVRNFLNQLTEQEMITIDTSQGVTVIELTNFYKHNPHLATKKSSPTAPSSSAQSAKSAIAKSASSKSKINNQKSTIHSTTRELVEYWNQCNDTSLKPDAKGRATQVKARLRTYTVQELKAAIYNRAHTKWTHENNQQANWDAVFRNDKQIDQWRNREPDMKSDSTNPQQPKNPASLGYYAKEKAQKIAADHRKEFNGSNFEKLEHQGTQYYKPIFPH